MTELMGMVDSAVDIIMEGELTFGQALNLLGEIEETTETTLPAVVDDYQQILEHKLKPLLYRYTVEIPVVEPPQDDGPQEETTKADSPRQGSPSK